MAFHSHIQENVGRLGEEIIPNGIRLQSEASYTAVGSRINTFLKLSVVVASYDEYRQRMIDHLVGKKVGHWDVVIRDLTALALQNLTAICTREMIAAVPPGWIAMAPSNAALSARHGSIVAIGHILHGLSNANKSLPDLLDAKVLSSIKQIPVSLVQRLALKITGGDLLRQALVTFVDQCSRAHFPIHDDERTLDLWQAIIGESKGKANMI